MASERKSAKGQSRINSEFSMGKISTGLTGVAGEHFVAAELSRRGLIASITIRNAQGVDILVTDSSASRTLAIQVKTNQGYRKHWMLSKKSELMVGPNFFYVLVNLDTDNRYPEFHVVPSAILATFIRDSHQQWLTTPGKKGQAHNDSDLRKFSDAEDIYLERWELLGLPV